MSKLDLTRRQFLSSLAAAPLIAVSATSAYASLIEPHNYEITETDIFIRDLPGRFEGFRITQITDVHHSRIVGIEQVRRVVQLAQNTKPDLFVLTGDYTTTYRRYVEPCAETLGALNAPEGVWAILGNHDHYTDPELTTRALEGHKITVLNNANTIIKRGPDAIQLAGIDDWSWNGTDWKRALYGLNPRRPIVLLSHQPSVFDLDEARAASLILSGHTHGGQIKLPVIGAPARFVTQHLKYASGLFKRVESQLYVSRGTGVIGLPVRLGVKPEIAVLRLRQARE
ncbi:MAG TPA: metallophosphoesterase [Pyrinomonadaceae bacterium]|nr:metallophosphoesterase [Pyrinomonadaceae bacterium]